MEISVEFESRKPTSDDGDILAVVELSDGERDIFVARVDNYEDLVTADEYATDIGWEACHVSAWVPLIVFHNMPLAKGEESN